jgi:PHD/YefM family antitoxin component YafN of YafNO toxin-antitoxin module
MTKVTITDLRLQIRKLADLVRHYGERVCVERNGEMVFAMISYEDLETLEAIEDRIDLETAKQAIKEGNFVDLDNLIKELKL